MASGPFVSVIIPVYNAEKYIERCINSVLVQTFVDFELILVDDGSNDSSGTICDRMAANDKRVRVMHKVNGGVSAARNSGMSAANGKWLCFVDADDYVTPTYLENLCSGIGKGSPDLVLGGRTKIMLDGTRVCTIPDNAYYEKKDFAKLFTLDSTRKVLISPWAKLLKKEFIIEGELEFKEGIHYLEDAIFFMSILLQAQAVAFVATADYCYELHPGSLVSKSYPLDTELLAYETFASLHEQFRARYDIPVREDDWFVWNRLFLFYRAMAAAKAPASMKKKLDNFKRLDWDFYSKPIHPHTPRTILRKHLLTTFNKWGGAIIYLYLNRLGLL